MIKRFKTIVSLAGVFNSDIEFIEYTTKKGTFYRIGHCNKDKVGLDFTICDNIFKSRGIMKWYEPLPPIDIKKSEEFPFLHVDVRKSIDYLDSEIKAQKKRLDSLLSQRRDLTRMIYDY